MTDKLAWIIFAVLLAMCLVVGIALSIEEVPDGHGRVHPDYPTMQQAPPGAERHAKVLWFGYAFGALQIVLFVACLALGLRGGGRLGRRAIPLLVGGAIYLATFTAMVVAYRQFMLTGEAAIFLGFPAPTAWMLFGVWPVPLLFLFLYFLTFNRWVVTPEGMKRFRQIVDSRRQREEDAA